MALFDPLRQFCSSRRCVISPDIDAISIASMGGGKGVVARKKISPGAMIVSVPMELMLTARSARTYISSLASQRVVPGIEQSSAAVSKLTAVEVITAFLVLCEHDAAHPFHLLVRGLPRAYDNLLEIPPQDLETCVWSPRIRQKILSEKESFLLAYEHVTTAIPELSALPPSNGVYTGQLDVGEVGEAAPSTRSSTRRLPESQYLWAYNSLMSRGFAYDDDIWAMMPWVDYFNFSLHPNVTMSFSDKTRTYDFYTKRPVLAGQQLMLQYGRYSDFELLMWYGFTLRPVMFPSFAAERNVKSPTLRASRSKIVKEGQSTDDCDDEEAVEDLATVCAYVFSPTSDPNGDYPTGTEWAVEVAKSAGLKPSPSWISADCEHLHDMTIHDARIGLLVVSEGMKALLQKLALSNAPLSSSDVLRRIIEAELKSFKAACSSDDGADDGLEKKGLVDGLMRQLSQPVSKMALRMSADHVHLLETFLGVDEQHLSRLLRAG